MREGVMNPIPLVPRKVLLATDFTEQSAFADPYAIALTRASGGELVLAHVANIHRDHAGPGPDDPHLGPGKASPAFDLHRQSILEEAQRMLAEWPIGDTSGIVVRREVVAGSNAASGIVECAEKERADLIVLSSHGRGLMGVLFLGSVAKDVISKSSCPVLCVKRDEKGMLDSETGRLRIREVAAVMDDSESSQRTVELATQIAASHRARLHLLTAKPLDVPATVVAPDGEPVLPVDENLVRMIHERSERFERRVAKQPADVKVPLRMGLEERDIAQYATDHPIDVVVMSRKGIVESIAFLGGAPVRLLHGIHCPLLLV
jgi:nucleotide-binding universal stress UspA family protein